MGLTVGVRVHDEWYNDATLDRSDMERTVEELFLEIADQLEEQSKHSLYADEKSICEEEDRIQFMRSATKSLLATYRFHGVEVPSYAKVRELYPLVLKVKPSLVVGSNQPVISLQDEEKESVIANDQESDVPSFFCKACGESDELYVTVYEDWLLEREGKTICAYDQWLLRYKIAVVCLHCHGKGLIDLRETFGVPVTVRASITDDLGTLSEDYEVVMVENIAEALRYASRRLVSEIDLDWSRRDYRDRCAEPPLFRAEIEDSVIACVIEVNHGHTGESS